MTSYAAQFAGKPFVRRQIFFAGIFLICLANASSQTIAEAYVNDGVLNSIYKLFGFSPIVVFALVVAFWELLSVKTISRSGSYDMLFGVFSIVASFFPVYWAGWLSMSLMAAYGILSSESDKTLRRALLLFLVVTFPLLWGPVVIKLIGSSILGFETTLIGMIFNLDTIGNTFTSKDSSSTLTVFWPCSSFHSISLVLVGWTAFSTLLNHEPERSDVFWIGISALGVFLVNAIRLVAMAIYPEHFIDIHYGIGADITNIMTMIVISGSSLLACRRD